MKKQWLLLIILMAALFMGCEGVGDSADDDTPSNWKIVSLQDFTFTKTKDGISSSSHSPAQPVTNAYLSIEGNDFIVFVVDSLGNYTRTVTHCELGEYPNFSFLNEETVDTGLVGGSSPYLKVAGQMPIHYTGFDFLFYVTDTTGDKVAMEIEELKGEVLPMADWVPSSKDLFVDWKTFFTL